MKPFALKKHQALVWTLAFSPDGKTLASGSADNNVVIWDVPTGEDLMTLKHNGTVEALRFSPDGRILASAAHEPSRGSVCLWRAPADEEAPANTLRANDGPTVFDRPAESRFGHGDAAGVSRSGFGPHRAARGDRPSGTRSGSAAAFRLFQDGRRPVQHGPVVRGAVIEITTGGRFPQYRSFCPFANRRVAAVG